MVKSRLTSLVDGSFQAQMDVEPHPQVPNVAYCKHFYVLNPELWYAYLVQVRAGSDYN